jgi:hypothetical protein
VRRLGGEVEADESEEGKFGSVEKGSVEEGNGRKVEGRWKEGGKTRDIRRYKRQSSRIR